MAGLAGDSLQESGQRLRDVVALSTLPAIWLGAEPLRVAESLAAALYTGLQPELTCVCLRFSGDEEPVVTAQIGRNESDAAVAEELAPAVLEWAQTHDPDDLMIVPNPVGPGTLRISARPLAFGAECGAIAAGFAGDASPDAFQHLLLNIAATQATVAVKNEQLQRSLRQSIAEREKIFKLERRAHKDLETLHEVSGTLASELDLEKLVQRVTDAGTKLTGAEFGAFFYNSAGTGFSNSADPGESYLLYTLSGAPRAAFENFGMPRNTALFAPTFHGTGIIRLDDVHDDPRYGKSAPHYGMPKGHLPVRSYLAVPVHSRSGEVLGGLFFGHPDPGVFTARAERLAVGLAAQAAIAIDNARLYAAAQREIAARRQNEAGLAASEARFRALVSATAQIVWTADAHGEVEDSPSWCAFTGQTSEQWRGHGWLDAVHPDDRRRVTALWREAVEAGLPVHTEYRIRHLSGEWRWTNGRAVPLAGGDGRVAGWVGMLIDVSERKQAEQTQQLLVGELNHRVKNTLASVQAIAQQTLRRTSNPEQFVASFSGRLQALSLVHSQLSESTWHGADLGALIRDQAVLGPVDESRITVWGPSIVLEPQMAFHMAMVLHELSTNACKYGALSGLAGDVQISWTVQGNQLRLQWIERGGPMVTVPVSQGFGTSFIDQTAKAYGGEAQMLCEADGIAWTLTLALPHLVSGQAQQSPPSTGTPGPANGPVRSAAAARLTNLAGKRVLVVEDEMLVGLDVVSALEAVGIEALGPASTADEALRLLDEHTLDAALIDANLHGRPVDELAAALTRRGVPFAFVTGYDRNSLPRAFRSAPVITKPFTPDALIDATERLLSGREGGQTTIPLRGRPA